MTADTGPQPAVPPQSSIAGGEPLEPALRFDSPIGRPGEWLRDIAFALLLALPVTFIDVTLSRRGGLLANPTTYDGVAYVKVSQELRRNHYGLLKRRTESFEDVLKSHSPVWHGLMWLHYEILGEGEWQAATARFWPTFLLILLAGSVVRFRTDGRTGRLAAALTALLPVLSTSLRAATSEAAGDCSIGNGMHWYIADLRPDLLFSVLMAWSVASLVERPTSPHPGAAAIAGLFGALAILTKPTGAPVFCMAGGLAVLYVLWKGRRRFLRTLGILCCGLPPFALVLAPWLTTGALAGIIGYLRNTLGVGSYLYSDPNATFASEALHYWKLFPLFTGPWEGWLVLGGAAVAFAVAWRTAGRADPRFFGYLLTAFAVYAVASATPSKNPLLGQMYYFLVWIGGLAAVARWFGPDHPTAHRWAGRAVAGYAALVVVGGLLAFALRPTPSLTVGPHNREAWRQMSIDAGAGLDTKHHFFFLPAFGGPAGTYLHMMDECGNSPRYHPYESYLSVAFPEMREFFEAEVRCCRTALIFDDDAAAAPVQWGGPAEPYFRAAAEWVRWPGSGFVKSRSYTLQSWSQGDGSGIEAIRSYGVSLYVNPMPLPPPPAKAKPKL